MKKLRSFVTLLTALALCIPLCGALPVQASGDIVTYEVEGGKIQFNTLTRTVTHCDEHVTAANIPASIEGVPVYAIGNNVFQYCRDLERVTIPEGVTSIGDFVFNCCSNLKEVNLPKSLKTVGYAAFSKCTSLEEITIPDGVTQMGQSVFEGCTALRKAKLSGGLTVISSSTFSGCQNLDETAIPAGVTQIGMWAFNGCSSLKSINIPAGVDWISSGAFGGCISLTGITLPEGLTTIEDNLFAGCTGLTAIAIPSTVTRISGGAFNGCTGLTTITIPAGVTGIGALAFYRCENLTSVEMTGGVETIDYQAFYGCTKLQSISIPATLYLIGNEVFQYCYELSDVYYAGTEQQWGKVYNYDKSGFLTNAAIHYNSTMPPRIAYASTQNVLVDGRSVEFQAYALKDSNGYMTNYVKLRDVAYALNGSSAQFQVGWDGSVNIVTGTAYTANGSEMHTPFAGNRAYTYPTAVTKVNGTLADLSAIVLQDDNGGGYTYFKLRDLGKALGFNVDWSAEKGIFIETNKPYAG